MAGNILNGVQCPTLGCRPKFSSLIIWPHIKNMMISTIFWLMSYKKFEQFLVSVYKLQIAQYYTSIKSKSYFFHINWRDIFWNWISARTRWTFSTGFKFLSPNNKFSGFKIFGSNFRSYDSSNYQVITTQVKNILTINESD